MAKKKAGASKKEKGDPKFPYTTGPGVLRKILAEIPKRPKPNNLSLSTVKTWGLTKNNDASPLRVLKDLGLLGASGETLAPYASYMESPPRGPRALGVIIKQKYGQLFASSHEPQKNAAELKTFFQIHGGGADKTTELQVQTFKALCDYAEFSGDTSAVGTGGGTFTSETMSERAGGESGTSALPPIKIDLHIHLPENKTTRDYEAIIQDIAKYIYGRGDQAGG